MTRTCLIGRASGSAGVALGDDLAAVEDRALVGPQADPDLPADEPGRHRVAAQPDYGRESRRTVGVSVSP